MPLVYTRWQLKPGANRATLGDLVLDGCRAARANEGVRNARYYWADANSVVTLVDYEHARHVFAAPNTPEGAKRAFAIADLADREAWELWADARAGTEAYEQSR
ncbi:MAG: hypothetical protein ABI782_05475 [Anaerolineaceae bacterium]